MKKNSLFDDGNNEFRQIYLGLIFLFIGFCIPIFSGIRFDVYPIKNSVIMWFLLVAFMRLLLKVFLEKNAYEKYFHHGDDIGELRKSEFKNIFYFLFFIFYFFITFLGFFISSIFMEVFSK